MKKPLALILALAMCFSLCACGSDVKSLIKQIDSLNGNITLESGPFIEQAESLYNELSEKEKSKIPNYAILVSARDQFNDIFKNVEKVISMIDALPTQSEITFDDGYEISEVWNSYNALSEKEKGKVENIDKLNVSIETINNIPIEAKLLDPDCLEYFISVTNYTEYSWEISWKYLVEAISKANMRYEGVNIEFTLNTDDIVFGEMFSDVITAGLSENGYLFVSSPTYGVSTSTFGGYYSSYYSSDYISDMARISDRKFTSGNVYFNIGN